MSAAWVFRVANHKAVDLLRHQVRTHRHNREFAIVMTRHDHDCELDHLLHARVGGLPIRFRRFYDLRYRQGLTEREIARSLGVCRATVRWLDHSCRRSVGG